MSVRVSGFKFQQLSERMRRNIAEVLNEGAESCVSLGKQLAPVDTGFFRSQISQTAHATANNLRSAVEWAADYSSFLEYGTVNMEAQSSATPSFESSRRQVNNALLRVLR